MSEDVQNEWEHRSAIREYETFLEEMFERMGANQVRLNRRKAQFEEIFADPETWRDAEAYRKLYANLRSEIVALGNLKVSALNQRLKERFGPNTPHLVEVQA